MVKIHTRHAAPLLAACTCALAAWTLRPSSAGEIQSDALHAAPGAHEEPAREVVSPQSLVTAIRGTLPIIITAPHGGRVDVAGCEARTSGVTVLDTNTAEIALLVSQRLTARLGGKPYVVIAQFRRTYADANRAPGEAFECDAAKREYEAFHGAVRAFVDECRARHGNAILVDLHGQKRTPGAIYRGTRRGSTVAALLKRCGPEAVIGPDSIVGRLRAEGYTVLPRDEDEGGGDDATRSRASDGVAPEQKLAPEQELGGGYIVGLYGSANPDGIDAIQLEIGAQRMDAPWKTGRDIGDAIAAFARAYLPAAGEVNHEPGLDKEGQ